jgi:integrase
MHDQRIRAELNGARASGYIRTIERSTGPVFYAHIRTPDGRRLQRRLGRAWTKRSVSPEGFITRSQAEARLAAMIAGHDPDVATTPSSTTFADAAREWLRYVEHDRKRERSTVLGYRQAVEHRLLPVFGDMPIESIDVTIADRWRTSLVADGLSANSVNKMRWYAEAIVARAMKVWGVSVNPFAFIERQPDRPSGDFNILAPDELLALAAHAADDQDATLYTVAGFTGLRLGELLALRWSDLDFGARLVHVRRSYTRGEFKSPKSGRVRSVPMIDQVIGPLDGLSRRENFTDPDDLVFVNVVGDTLEESALRRRFYAALAAAGLKRIRLHDLRHSYCSLAVRAWRLDEVRAYAGHADLAMTMKYVHFIPAHDAADRLSRVVDLAVHPTVHPTEAVGAN